MFAFGYLKCGSKSSNKYECSAFADAVDHNRTRVHIKYMNIILIKIILNIKIRIYLNLRNYVGSN